MLNTLRAVISGYGSTIVAYSGGVDSAVVLFVARQQLGSRALGVIGNSPAYPESELSEAVALANSLDLPIRVIETNEHHDPHYIANAPDRCFHCRSNLFAQLVQLAAREGYSHVCDGVHADDAKDHAGGMKAAREFQVRSPLLEAGLGKEAVRAIARQLGLPVWNKPAMACLASRIPTGTPINISLLDRIADAEQALRDLGLADFRVRHHGDMARLELCGADFPHALEVREQIVQALRDAGYRRITLDLVPRHF